MLMLARPANNADSASRNVTRARPAHSVKKTICLVNIEIRHLQSKSFATSVNRECFI